MNNCTSGCRTKDHASYAECLQSKAPVSKNSTQGLDPMYARQYENQAIITEYKAAKSQGLQPPTSKLADIRATVAAAEKKG